MARLRPGGGARVLVVAPHPDDEAAGCAGALLLHASAGDEVRVAVVTDGRRSGAHGLGEEEMARCRRAEAAEAARALGAARFEWLGFPEGGGAEAAITGELARLVADADVVYAPPFVDFHPEHLRVAACLASAVQGGLVRVYQIQVPLARPLVNLVAEVDGVAEAFHETLGAYRTQRGALERTLRTRRYAGARHGGSRLVEEFWELPGTVYAALAREPDRRYRGLRRRAFSDPLAYLAGRGARRALARRARMNG